MSVSVQPSTLTSVASKLAALPEFAAPGKPVAPVVETLNDVSQKIGAALPDVQKIGASAWMVDELSRIANSTGTLADSLHELEVKDGMKTFDAAFANDKPGWDSWILDAAERVRSAADLVAKSGR